jgi:SOS-response transcriptional repressor LexA
MGVAYKKIDVVEGRLYIVRSPSGELFIGAYYRKGDEMLLKPANPDFPAITLHGSLRWNFVARVEWVTQFI